MESEMTIQAKLGARLVRGGLLLLFLLARICYGGTSAYQIESLAVSPDGKVIAIDIKKGGSAFIYTAAVDTGVAVRLTKAATGEETSPTFSADGKQIAFSHWPGEGARSRIAIVDVDGSNLHEWSPSGVAEFSPVLSPDNKTIVFARAEFYGSYSPISQPHPHDWGFYAADLDGTNVRQITNEGFYMASPASISRDGKSMVVVTEGLETNQRIAIYSLIEPGPATRSFQPHVPHEADPSIRFLRTQITRRTEVFCSWPPAMGSMALTMTFMNWNLKQVRWKGLPRETGMRLNLRSQLTEKLRHS